MVDERECRGPNSRSTGFIVANKIVYKENMIENSTNSDKRRREIHLGLFFFFLWVNMVLGHRYFLLQNFIFHTEKQRNHLHGSISVTFYLSIYPYEWLITWGYIPPTPPPSPVSLISGSSWCLTSRREFSLHHGLVMVVFDGHTLDCHICFYCTHVWCLRLQWVRYTVWLVLSTLDRFLCYNFEISFSWMALWDPLGQGGEICRCSLPEEERCSLLAFILFPPVWDFSSLPPASQIKLHSGWASCSIFLVISSHVLGYDVYSLIWVFQYLIVQMKSKLPEFKNVFPPTKPLAVWSNIHPLCKELVTKYYNLLGSRTARESNRLSYFADETKVTTIKL